MPNLTHLCSPTKKIHQKQIRLTLPVPADFQPDMDEVDGRSPHAWSCLLLCYHKWETKDLRRNPHEMLKFLHGKCSPGLWACWCWSGFIIPPVVRVRNTHQGLKTTVCETTTKSHKSRMWDHKSHPTKRFSKEELQIRYHLPLHNWRESGECLLLIPDELDFC